MLVYQAGLFFRIGRQSLCSFNVHILRVTGSTQDVPLHTFRHRCKKLEPREEVGGTLAVKGIADGFKLRLEGRILL